jgi:membrane fusion protein, multidrug efflux system
MSRLRLASLAAVAVLGLGGWYWVAQAPATTAPAAAPPAIPVETALAARADVPVYVEGLGTVQAFNTVTVTTRVDGQMQTVDFVEGQDVKAGDVLAQIDPRLFQAALDQAVATKAKDEAQLANAKLDLQRFITLAPQNFTSKQTLDTQRALVAQLEAQVKIDQAAIDTARTNLDYTTIRSPINGRTGIRLVDAGNNLLTAANTSVVVVTQLQPISVIVTLPEEDFREIATALKAGAVTVVALSRDGTTELDRGEVAALDNQINQATGTMRLKVTFPNKSETLWPGLFVNARLLLHTERNVLTVPSAAVQRGADGLYAYVLKPDASVEMRPLKVGQNDGSVAVIEGGLQPGERVVTAGQYRLQPGARAQSATADAASAAPSQPATQSSTP